MWDGLIQIPDDPRYVGLDSEKGKKIGFTSDRFTEASYLFDRGDCVYISFIEAREKGKGNLNQLFQNILDTGKIIKVPTPLPLMGHILKKKGSRHTTETDKDFGNVEVWVKP